MPDAKDYPTNSTASKTAGTPQVPTRNRQPNRKKFNSTPDAAMLLESPKIPEEKIVKKASVTPKVRKEGTVQTAIKNFFGADTNSVVAYIVWDVLIPAAKETVIDMIREGVDMLLSPGGSSGRSRPRRGGGYGGTSRVSYGNFYRDNQRSARPAYRNRDHDDTRRPRPKALAERANSRSPGSRLQAVVFDRDSEAREVVGLLSEILDMYDEVTVADFYEVSGLQNHSQPSDNSWGWRDLANVTISQTRDGYEINFPRVEQI
ncbi:unnamed protein product [marine sediment metagenome]|uniref:Uncharacterized protein n=1 Tax=marine sediment metagenome TaxID=412755 RepID=X0RG02_9ZZZZ